jgi:hypothetical protein
MDDKIKITKEGDQFYQEACEIFYKAIKEGCRAASEELGILDLSDEKAYALLLAIASAQAQSLVECTAVVISETMTHRELVDNFISGAFEIDDGTIADLKKGMMDA